MSSHRLHVIWAGCFGLELAMATPGWSSCAAAQETTGGAVDLGYYLGHDYYNIYFDRIVHTLQIGISGAVTPAFFQSD